MVKQLTITPNGVAGVLRNLRLGPPVEHKTRAGVAMKPTYAAGRWFRCEEVPEELMYDDFIYPEDIEMECFESDPTNFDSLPPIDEKLWQEELARRERWFRSWHKPDKRCSQITKRRSPRDFRDFAKSGRF